jgi:four helix bundle protein
MTAIRSFEDIEAWKESRAITRKIYDLTKRKAFAKDFGLRGQICRAAVSIMSNIAEGYESQTHAVFIRHLSIAKGSAGELRSQQYVALDQAYISKSEFDALREQTCKVFSQLSRLRTYLKKIVER